MFRLDMLKANDHVHAGLLWTCMFLKLKKSDIVNSIVTTKEFKEILQYHFGPYHSLIWMFGEQQYVIGLFCYTVPAILDLAHFFPFSIRESSWYYFSTCSVEVPSKLEPLLKCVPKCDDNKVSANDWSESVIIGARPTGNSVTVICLS